MDILVPCKGIVTGKSRLRACLGAAERRELCEWFLTNILNVAVRLAGPNRVHVITSEPEAAAVARRFAVRLIADPGRGLNEALEVARAKLLSDVGSGILILPTDLPYVDDEALAKILGYEGDMVVAPDERGTGTNALYLRNAAIRELLFTFGSNSFAAHLASARALCLSAQVLRDWRLGFDIDEPTQYFEWLENSGVELPRLLVSK